MSGHPEAWLTLFLEHLQHRRRLSPATCAAYRRDLEQLLEYCREQGLSGWQSLDASDVRAYAAWRYRNGTGGRSLQRALSAARTFFSYLNREGLVSRNPALGVAAPKGRRMLPEVLDADRVQFQNSAPRPCEQSRTKW